MMQNKKISKPFKKGAFTLLEMIIAITIFTIFIGFAISSYLVFHRADQRALVTRNLIMESESLMDTLSEAIQKNKILYSVYESTESESIATSELYLVSPDGLNVYSYVWDSEEEALYMQINQISGDDLVPVDGYEEPIKLNALGTQITACNFDIFPAVNPYASENRANSDVQFQPIVSIDLDLKSANDSAGEVSVDLHTSVTSRFYQ